MIHTLYGSVVSYLLLTDEPCLPVDWPPLRSTETIEPLPLPLVTSTYCHVNFILARPIVLYGRIVINQRVGDGVTTDQREVVL